MKNTEIFLVNFIVTDHFYQNLSLSNLLQLNICILCFPISFGAHIQISTNSHQFKKNLNFYYFKTFFTEL